VNINESPKEFRLKSGSKVMNYIRSFSVTEKTILALLVIVAGITAISMLVKVSELFMVEVPATGGELREGMVGLPHMINPVLAITDSDRDISALVYSGLMKYKDGELITDLAETYKISDDGLTYSFTLKPNLHFSDGEQLTTADIAYTIQKVQSINLKSPRRADWNNVTVNVISPNEISFVLKQPYSPFITNTTLGILPKHVWENLSDDQFIFSEYNIEPIGSGPYKIKAIVRDNSGIPEKYELISSNKYYDHKAYINSITFVFFADIESALSALENGVIDSLASVPSSEINRFVSDCLTKEDCESESRYSIVTSPLPRIFGVFFNQSNNTILADKNVRQALDISIDRSKIINSVLNGYGASITGPILYATSSTTNVKADPALARSILEKAGWVKNGTTGIYEKKGPKNTLQILTFDLATSDTPDLKQTAEIVKEAWTAIGAKVDIKIFDSAELYQNIIRPRKYDALLFGQLIGKDRDIYAFWHSSQRNSPGLNVAMYANSKADTILETIRTTSDEKIRATKYAELQKIIQTDIPAIFLYSPNFIYMLPKKINNIPKGGFSLTNITVPSDRWNSSTDWYIKTEKIWKIFAK
jgi:peptide/nickel transport system substrate-binding protein